MTLIVTTDYELDRVAAPNLPLAPPKWDKRFHDQYSNVLRLYFNRLDAFIAKLMATQSTLPVTGTVGLPPTYLDAFGRQRVSQPYTLFDSQNRYAADNQFDVATTGTGTTTFLSNEATVQMSVTAGGVGSVKRQSYRSLPYQPGKGLLVLATFVMDSSQSLNLTQRVGYYNDSNGVFFQRVDGTYSFVLRSSVTGAPSDARTVTQANWNGDKLDGTGASGLTLDPTKAQILWMDFEWLG
ncbi:hypothetical protein EBT31_21825, partial [bacterium]|nr:hypothetical protein [bacterium]